MPDIKNISFNSSEALLPTAYSLQEVTFTNHAGKQFNLKALVTDLTITESVYRPGLLLSLNVKDPVNTLEEFQMTGQEKIFISLARKPYGSKEEVKIQLNFIVTEYPLFGRFGSRLQVYSIRGVTPHAFSSELKRVSRAFSGDARTFIKNVLIRDLNVDEKDIVISNKASKLVNFIVPNLPPLDAIHWVLRRCYDEAGSPFYFFQKLDGKIYLLSQSDMVSQEPYSEYKDAKFFQHNQSGDKSLQKDYDQRARRILSLASDVRMSKYEAIPKGAYASTSQYVDLATKSSSKSSFVYSKEFGRMTWIDPNPVISSGFNPEPDKKTLSDFSQSMLNFISINSMSHDVGVNYHDVTRSGVLNRAQSYMENLDNISHDISVAGDFKINAGITVDLILPPALDPEVTEKNSVAKNDFKKDNYFSGKYLVTSVVHNFSTEYTVNAKVKRDTLPFKLSS